MQHRTLKPFILAVVAAAAVSLASAADTKQAQNPKMEVETVIATVNGVPITKNDLYNGMIQFYPAQAQDTLDRIVSEIVVTKEAASRGVAVTDKDVAKKAEELGLTGPLTAGAKSAIKTSMLAEKMIADQYGIRVTNDDVKKFFDEKKELLGDPEQVHLRQIFVVSEKDANDIMLALNAGADFIKMAQAKSLDAASKAKGGDIGFFAKGMLVPELEKIVFALKPGDYSQPVKTDNGYHIIKLEEKKAPKNAKFDAEMKKRLEVMIKSAKIQEALPGWLDGLRKKADIK
jgi:foldase protein PrsA